MADVPDHGYGRAFEIDRRHADLGMGFVDCDVLALAEVLGLPRVATTDRRHFGAVRIGVALTLLP